MEQIGNHEISITVQVEALDLSLRSLSKELEMRQREVDILFEPEVVLVPVAVVVPRVSNVARVVPESMEEGEIGVSDVVSVAVDGVEESAGETLSRETTTEEVEYSIVLSATHRRLILYERARRCLLKQIIRGDVTGDLNAGANAGSRLFDKRTIERAIVRNIRLVHDIDSKLASRRSRTAQHD
jgi:hypothetical protein